MSARGTIMVFAGAPYFTGFLSDSIFRMYPYRTRFKKEIVAEFLPPWLLVRRAGRPARFDPQKPQKVIIFCGGMPGMPRYNSLLEFLSKKGFWAFHPRYRGSWESGGSFLERSPEEDVRDVIDGLYGEIQDLTWGKKFRLKPGKIFVIGGSFGGPAAILALRDPRVAKAVAGSPVTDWKVSTSRKAVRAETSDPSYVHYIQQAFGMGYRVKGKNWNKLRTGKFYNPMPLWREVDGKKLLLYHAKDDPVVGWKETAKFAKLTGAKLVLWKRGGHLSAARVVQKDWKRISEFLKKAT